jgi:nucleotidyltransferase substrate binding protein (TIGR01987 family)
VERDAAIQRFEYTFEAVWRCGQRFLLVKEGLSIASPKACVRSCGQVGLLSEAQMEQALAMTDDRNLTVHTYNESLANAIYARLAGHVEILSSWLRAMRERVSGPH